MIRWFKSLFAWETVFATGVWVYLQNKITGQRKAVWRGAGYSPPLYRDFLRDGDIIVGPRGRYVISSEIWRS